MPLQLRCSHCRTTWTADTRPGLRVSCPHCRQTLTLPAAGSEHIRAAESRYGTPVPRAVKESTQPLRRPVGGKKGFPIDWRIVGVAASLAVLFVVGLVASIAQLNRSGPEPESVAVTEQETTVSVEELPPAPPTKIQVPPKVEEPPAPKAVVFEEIAAPAVASPKVAVAEPPAPVPAPVAPKPVMPPKEPAKPTELVVKRLHHLTDEDLRRQLLAMPELSLDRAPHTSTKIVILASQQAANPQGNAQPHVVPKLLAPRTDLAGLPMRMGAECQLGKESAESLQALSRKLRTYLGESIPKDGTDPRPDPAVLRRKLMEGEDAARREWQLAAAIPTLQQMLQAENSPSRLLLIDLLAQIKDQTASAALAQRALYDLSSEVRAAAIRKLADRPRDDYRAVLVEGFRYPWQPVAEHAAEALVAVQDVEAVPALKKLLKEPDPAVPYLDSKGKSFLVREVVRINHLKNCLMCHAPSSSRTDLVRGVIPTPGQPLPPPTTVQYYDATQGIFVRADVTYLKQDFSVPQPVDKPGNWPTMQRYDYLVRSRPAVIDDFKRKPNTKQRDEAIQFALMRLN